MTSSDKEASEPTKDQFAQAVIAEFRRAGDTSAIDYNPTEFRLKIASGGEINLGNVYRDHCQMGEDARQKQVSDLVQTVLTACRSLPTLFEDARAHLRPKIWARATLSELDLRARLEGTKAAQMTWYPLGSHMVSTVVYDQKTSMRSLAPEDLEAWGITYYEAMEIACENLSEATLSFTKLGDAFYASVMNDNYDGARLLLRDRILSWDVVGDHVAVVPHRDALLVTGSQDKLGLKMLTELTEITSEGIPRLLSPIPLRLVDGEWEDWFVPRSHPQHPLAQKLALKFLAKIYGGQKLLLDAIHAKEGKKTSTAKYSALQTSAGAQRSYCVWTEGPILLPKTELVMFGEEQSQPYEWDSVLRVAANRLELADDLYPARYHASRLPSAKQMQQLKSFNL